MAQIFQLIVSFFAGIYLDAQPVVIEPVSVTKVTDMSQYVVEVTPTKETFMALMPSSAPVVLGVTAAVPPTPTVAPTIAPTPVPPKPTPTKKPRKTRKESYTIALLGDSMIDTLGPTVESLTIALNKIYRDTTFTIKNYGAGGTNILSGIDRVTNGYEYLGVQIPPLASQNPDIVVIESFGYNPFSYDIGAIDAHWLALAKAVDAVEEHIPKAKIVIAATIAPNSKVFGNVGTTALYDDVGKWQKVNTIKQYLDNAVRFARSEHLPLANAYQPSIDATGNGKLLYINPGDHIHYSDEGRRFFSQTVADTIIENKLLE